jgi:hypothetical protein
VAGAIDAGAVRYWSDLTVAYYVAPDAPGIKVLGWWNVLIGFAFLAMGFVVSTKWR